MDRIFVCVVLCTTVDALVGQAHQRERLLRLNVASAPELEFLSTTADEELTPGKKDDSIFICDSSVRFWKDFESKGNDGNVQMVTDLVSKRLSQGSLARAYWGSHLLRSGYFTVNAVLGSLASDLHERFIVGRSDVTSTVQNNSGGSILNASPQEGMLGRLLNSDVPTRLILEAMQCYEQDFKYVQEGLLKFPWDAPVKNDKVQFDHRQMNPLFVLSETTRTIRESVDIFGRRNKKMPGRSWLEKSVDDAIYPEYYKNDFHYQTDGWFSSESADRYEASTETLFLGRQDAMQRQTLIPLLKSETTFGSILEVACGTGRFGTFLRDNFPDAQVTYSDLSPFYLEKAKKNDEYWVSYRGEAAMEESTGRRVTPELAKFVQANAESLPFDDNSFDAVACIYLFHEMPEDARARAAAEMVRVVKPGGTIVLTDSNQLGDRPSMDQAMENFSNLNEPFYHNYIRTHLYELFEGCEFGEKYVSSNTKTLSFTKK